MKVPLAIFFISTIYISLESVNGLHDSKIIVGTYPKKVKNPLKKSIHIVNNRKFENLKNSYILDSRKANYYKSNNLALKNFTVFPSAQKYLKIKPELFNLQSDDINRKRVKKVLPDYDFSLIRKKRYVGSQVNSTGVTRTTEKNKNVKRNRNNRKRIKRKGVNKYARKSTIVKKHNVRSKSKTTKVKVPLNKTKTRNRNLMNVRKLRRDKKRSSRKLKNIKKHKNQSKVLLPGRDEIGPKKVIREQEKKVMNRRLVAGRDAMIRDYPYVVSIQKDNQHWCSGALLNPRLVITTANCVWKAKRISRMRVRAGSRHLDRDGQLVKIQEVMKHPSWSIRSQPDNDVALLLLNKKIKFSDSVHSVDLPNRAMWPAFEDVWITSWGAERRDGIFQPGLTLQVYHSMLLDHEKCNNVTMRFGIVVSRNFICVTQTGRRAPCTRDTGAPAVSDGILWGVASWGLRKLKMSDSNFDNSILCRTSVRCGTERYPAMFSYLASRSNLDFITNATHVLMSDKRFYPYGDRFVLKEGVTTSTEATTPF